MKVEQWQLTQLRPYEHKPRLNDEAVDVVAASIREFGFRQPIVVDENGVIIGIFGVGIFGDTPFDA